MCTPLEFGNAGMFKKRRILRRCPGIAAGAGAASAMSASSKAGAASASGLERVRNGPSVCGSFAATWARIMSRMVRIGTRGARETFLDGGKGESPRAAQNSLNASGAKLTWACVTRTVNGTGQLLVPPPGDVFGLSVRGPSFRARKLPLRRGKLSQTRVPRPPGSTKAGRGAVRCGGRRRE